jgi:hypothetical protein
VDGVKLAGGIRMRILFDGEPSVDYGQIYVHSSQDWASEPEPLEAAFAGQSNGLCGAAVPGGLFLLIGLSVGEVRLTVELHEAEPPVGEDWEEVVEAPYRPVGVAVALVEWAGIKSWPLDLPATDLRVRYCATGMNATADDDPMGAKPTVVERYLLQFWPAAAAADQVVRQTTEVAAYWHDYARQQQRS